jgi:hypothetical protein
LEPFQQFGLAIIPPAAGALIVEQGCLAHALRVYRVPHSHMPNMAFWGSG